jgi:predicted Rossmann fold nucleotide-binding protein DprA/Smf involved in DNA uptake
LRAADARRLFALGDLGILNRPTLGILCSTRCPGELALRAYDLARHVAEHGPVVVSGFHSPVEAAFLQVLLEGVHPAVWCLARHLDPARLDPAYLEAAAAGKLLLLSTFGPHARSASGRRARVRNLLVASLAARVLVIHADQGGNVERCCRAIRGREGPLLTFDAPCNAGLVALGARTLSEPR